MTRSLPLLAALILVSCGQLKNGSDHNGLEYPDWNLNWVQIDSLNERLPESIRVYHADQPAPRLNAWYVDIDLNDSTRDAEVLVSTDIDGRETVLEMAQRTQGHVLVNGGYFRMDLNPAVHVGVLQVDGRLIEPPTPSVIRDTQRFPVNRAAIGFSEQDEVEIGWVSRSADSLLLWHVPIANAEGQPGELPPRKFSRSWSVDDVLGGGPLLIRDGKINIAWESEVFFGTSIPEVHPRTAAGLTANNHLILLVVDGRQNVSRGVDLKELAHILFGLGCQDALNLDGGGSSTLIVDGILLNRPAGSDELREVMSAIAIF
jgi:hypothetical protein